MEGIYAMGKTRYLGIQNVEQLLKISFFFDPELQMLPTTQHQRI